MGEKFLILRNALLFLVASVAMGLLTLFFPISFEGDRGLVYVREFRVTPTKVAVVHRSLDSDLCFEKQHIATWPLTAGAALTALVSLVGCFCWNEDRTHAVATAALLLAVAYIIIMVGYLLYIVLELVATFLPSWSAAMPFIALCCLFRIYFR